jgi:TrmH family RNA methyltransferase
VAADAVTEPLSPNNPRIKHLAKLVRDRRARRDEHMLVVDGPRALSTYFESGGSIEAVFTDEPNQSILRGIDPGLVNLVERSVLDRISDSVTPQGVLAVGRYDRLDLDTFLGTSPPPVTVVLDAVQDPGNVGAVVRIAAAFGAAVVCGGGCADAFSPRAVRASAGTIAAVAVLADVEAAVALAGMQRHGVRVIGTAMTGGVAPDAVKVSGPVAIVVGSEGAGMSDSVEALVDSNITVPMRAPVESLNVAVTVGIVLYHLRSLD